jgi:serine protease
MTRKACALFTWMMCLSLSMSSALLANQPEVTELIVRFKPGVGVVENLDEVILSVNDGKHEALKKRLSSPVNIRPFLNSYNRSGHKPQALAKDKRKSPREILDEYVVLSYSDNRALRSAKEILKKDDDVLWFGENSYVTLSAMPNDPLNGAAVVGPIGESDYQWALNTLNMAEAWDYSKGHAYIAMIDFGIQTDHPDILGNFRDQFSARIVSYQKANDDGSIDNSATTSSGYEVDELSVLQTITDYEKLVNNGFTIRLGHGTHVAGIIAAKQNNGIGVTGICGDCSLMVNHTGEPWFRSSSNIVYTKMPSTSLANNIIWLTDTGAQVINMSLGGVPQLPFAPENGCSGGTRVDGTWRAYDDLYPMCIALRHADRSDVVMIAATGNDGDTSIHFPASDPRVIAVGAVSKNGDKPYWSNTGLELDLAAPGENILSTFYTDKTWIHPDDQGPFSPECGDDFSAQSGYGPCSGTSMATPHVSGIAALLRSINPLLSKGKIKALLTEHASLSETGWSSELGYGVPNAAESVKAAMGTVNGKVLQNRLTPLFSLYSSDGEDHLYTTVPQMAAAAMYEALRPQPFDEEIDKYQRPSNPVQWQSIGRWTPGYVSFPHFSWMMMERAKASVYIFTTNDNPLVEGEPEEEDQASRLIPLYRLSYQGKKGGNTRNIDHTYATSQAEINFFEHPDRGYKLDGIEGYIYPRTMPQQPLGTVKLYRKFNETIYDHAIFPESELSSMIDQGYNQNSGNDWIGYVYPNQDSDGDTLIDGFELVIGTNTTNPDTDGDGRKDGLEVLTYYTDPLN